MTPIGPGRSPYAAPAYPGYGAEPSNGPTGEGSSDSSGAGPLRPAGRNGYAVAALAVPFAALGLPGILGVVLGIVALRQVRAARRRGEQQRGQGLAIAGIVVGTLMTALWVAAAWFVVWAVQLADRSDYYSVPARVDARVEIYLESVSPGHCLDLPRIGTGSRVFVMPCDEPHTAELLARIPVQTAPGGGFPGRPAMQREAASACERRLATLPPASAGLFRALPLAPTAELWADGETTAWCFVTSRHGPVTGSIAADDVALAR